MSRAQQLTRGEGVTVCVIDNIFDGSHPDLVGADFAVAADLSRALPGDFATFERSHGTSVAGLLVGQGSGPSRSEGTRGVAPNASVRTVKTLDRGPSVADSLKACADLGASVISVSLAGSVDAQAMAYAQARDAVVVVGTGNTGSTTSINDLAGLWGVVAVTGIDASLGHDPGADTAGATFPFRDIDPDPGAFDRGGTVVAGPYSKQAGPVGSSPLASCVNGLPVPRFDGGYEWACGTSLATPIVAGVVALVRSAHPELNAANVVNRLIKTAKPMGAPTVPSPPLGFGVVDAYAAVTAQVPLVDHNPLGSCYTGGRGVWDDRAKPTRPEPPVGTKLAPAPVLDPIADVPAATALPTSAAPSPAAGQPTSGLPLGLWLGIIAAVVLALAAGLIAILAKTRRANSSTRS